MNLFCRYSLILLVSAIAAAQQTQTPPFTVEIVRDVMVPVRDGVRLATDLYLPASGKLIDTAAAGSARTFVFDPADPVTTIGGRYGVRSLTPPCFQDQVCRPGIFGCRDARPLSERSNVLTFSTEPLTEEMEVTGPVRARLWVSTDAPDTNFTGKLIDVDPNGYAAVLGDGQIRLRYRKGFDKDHTVKPAEVAEVEIELGSTSNVFAKGHRIRPDISSSNWPRVEPSPNTGTPVNNGTGKRKARNTVYLDTNRPSHVDLPVVPQMTRQPADERVLMNRDFLLMSSQSQIETAIPKPPVAPAKPHKLTKHGHTRTDNYYWLKERTDPEVIAYLKAENDYLDQTLAHVKPLRAKLFDEFKARIKQTDESVPYRKDGYFYYTRMESGKNYPVHCRRKGSLDAPEEILLDGNKEAQGHKYFSAQVEVSPANNLIAYAADTVGRRFYDIRFRNLQSGADLPDVIKNVTDSLAWANDNKTLFYGRQDPQTLRTYQVYRHVLGSDPARDQLVFEEKDDTFNAFVFKTKSKKYIIIGSRQTLSTEYRFLDADRPNGEFSIIERRKRDHEYSVDHYGEHFYFKTNHNAKNFRLMRAPVAASGLANWQEVIGHRPDTLLENIELFRDYLVVVERRNGLRQFQVRPWTSREPHYVTFEDPAYAASLTANVDFETPLVRFQYSSLKTPQSVYDYDMKTQKRTLLKRTEVLAGFDSNNYVTERLYAPSHDGVKVPISLVYRKGFAKNASSPMLQTAYGSYGYSRDAAFDPFIISLLDRGFVYAIAHIRGGQEMGRNWYEDGRLLNKKNTFRDFIAATEHLVTSKYTDPKHVYALGGSAGGLLMGAVMNMRPDLYHGIIAAVPFVDIVTTMLDDTIPLTTFEYDEWGNPNIQVFYEYMLSYSPYDQLEAKAYPNLLVTTGLHDSQVQYWEPAKWVAKLRALKTDKNRILFYTNMDAGHGLASARYKKYEEVALQYAFLLDLAGLKQ